MGTKLNFLTLLAFSVVACAWLVIYASKHRARESSRAMTQESQAQAKEDQSDGVLEVYRGTNVLTTNEISTFTDISINTTITGANFLTITNRPWIRMGDSIIVRVTDDEWKLITNAYRGKINTNSLEFYGNLK